MSYQMRQDANGSDYLAAKAQAAMADEGRVARAAVELKAATEAYEKAMAEYVASPRVTSGSTARRDV